MGRGIVLSWAFIVAMATIGSYGGIEAYRDAVKEREARDNTEKQR